MLLSSPPTDWDLVQLYRDQPNVGGVHAQTAPGRLGAVARLNGICAAAPSSARVLELGCLRGENLLAMAADHPNGTFMGVDLLEGEITTAQRAANGSRHIQFGVADLRTFDVAPLGFDYIICHGVFSWVADDVKDAVFRICKRGLAENGVAYVSYNTHPGWLYRHGLRELLQAFRPEEEAGGTRRAVDVLSAMQGGLVGRQDSYAAVLRGEVADVVGKAGINLPHDELAPINDPCYFLQFIEWAAEHGLAYVGESPWFEPTPSQYPTGVWQTLCDAGVGRLEHEQFFDFLLNRRFRGSVLCRQEAVPETSRGLQLTGLALESRLRVVEDGIDLGPDAVMQFRDEATSASVMLSEASTKAALVLLGKAGTVVSFADVCERVRQMVPHGFNASLLERSLVELLRRGHLEVRWPSASLLADRGRG